MARNGASFEFDANEFLLYAFSLLAGYSLFAYKILLVEFHKHAQTGHDGRDVVGQFIAVEGQSHLEAQRVAAAQSAGLCLFAFYETVPGSLDVGV